MKISIGIFLFLLVNSIADCRKKRIWLPSVWVAIPCFLYCLWEADRPVGFYLICGIVTGAGMISFSRLTEGQIGPGDGIIMGSIMLAMGLWSGLTCIFFAMIYAFFIAVLLVVFFHKKKDFRMPFVPFLLLGYLTWLSGR